jgi:arsenite-transporting ATPase
MDYQTVLFPLSNSFPQIVFDTAPTGHTLRFLSFPSVLEKALGKLSGISGRIAPLMSQFSGMMGGGSAAPQEGIFSQ